MLGKRSLFKGKGVRGTELREIRGDQGPWGAVHTNVWDTCQQRGLCGSVNGLRGMVYRHRGELTCLKCSFHIA